MHTHTNFSDGLYPPKELIHKAINKGLDGISITDHDTVDGISVALEYIKDFNNFQIIPGIEFSSSFSDSEVHILGYFIDIKNEELLSMIARIKSSRWDRGISILDKLNDMNMVLPRPELLKEASESGFIGRANIARKLVEFNYVEDINEAFEKYLSIGKPAYVERFKLSIKDTIDLIHASKGISVLAHPGLIEDQNALNECLKYGIMGIECYQSKHSKAQTIEYLDFCKKYNLIATGGSDYHGDEDILGNFTTDIDSIGIFKERI